MTSVARRRFAALPLFHWLALGIVAAAGCWAAWAAANGQLGIAAAMAGVVGFGIALVAPRRKLLPLIRLLLTCAIFMNAVGYALGLWVESTPFDEVMHAFTSFAATAGVTWLLLNRTSMIDGRKPLRLVAAAIGIGLALGIAWELFEWLIGIVGGVEDTLVDMVMDLIGAAGAGLLCAWAASQRHGGNG